MKSLRTLSLVTLVLALAPTTLGADFGVRFGRAGDTKEEFVGAEILLDLGAINLNPNLEYSLEDEVTAGTANIDITLDVASIGSFRPYVGAGLGLAYFDNDQGQSDTNIIGNLLGGVSFDLNMLTPYAQVKYFQPLDNDEGRDEGDISFAIGLRF